MKYEIRYKCGAEKTDLLFMVHSELDLSFHPNLTDQIFTWDDYHEIESISLNIDEYPTTNIIELKIRMLLWQGDYKSTLEHIKEEEKEMLECGWKPSYWYSNLPDLESECEKTNSI